MNPEIELLNEVWDIVREHVAKKDRVLVAEEILRSFDAHMDMSEIDLYKNDFDTSMKAALLAFTGDEESELDDDWE
jgi:hypothetical protein